MGVAANLTAVVVGLMMFGAIVLPVPVAAQSGPYIVSTYCYTVTNFGQLPYRQCMAAYSDGSTSSWREPVFRRT